MVFCNITKKECKNKVSCSDCDIFNNPENYKKMDEENIKTMRDISTELQTYCHNGESHKQIKVRVLDAYYNITGIKKVVSGDETYFVIETEV